MKQKKLETDIDRALKKIEEHQPKIEVNSEVKAYDETGTQIKKGLLPLSSLAGRNSNALMIEKSNT